MSCGTSPRRQRESSRHEDERMQDSAVTRQRGSNAENRRDAAKRPHAVLQPPGWPRPAGYANGIKAHGTFVFVGGMVGWDAQERFPTGFVAQARQTLMNIAAVLHEGGAEPKHLVRMTWYVRDMDEYLGCRDALGAAYREVIGSHYPAMALVEVARLAEPEALLEIEATAVVP
jgi:enamine deaminase RidA (YjgF/YER057c/UK114 family)